MGVGDAILKALEAGSDHERAMNDQQPVLMDLATVACGRPIPAVLSAAVNFLVIVALEQMERTKNNMVQGATETATRAFLHSVGHELIVLSQRRGDIPLDERLKAAQRQLRRPWPPQ